MRPLLALMALITLLSSWPDLNLTQFPTWFRQPHHYVMWQWNPSLFLSWDNPFFSIPSLRDPNVILHKIGHIGAYSLLGWLAFRSLRSIPKSLLTALGFALFDELHQAFVPGRGSRLFDVLLDTTVALAAIALSSALARKANKKKPALRS